MNFTFAVSTLNAKNMEEYDITLITAARRRFDSWDKALTAAGLNWQKIVCIPALETSCRGAEKYDGAVIRK